MQFKKFSMKELGSIALFLTLVACATSPLGRKQLMLIPDNQMDQMGAQSFAQLKTQQPIESNPAMNQYVKCIVDPLTQAAQGQTSITNWDVVVFKDPGANAFALPGGKIGVNTGIVPVAKTDAQLAAVIGHEIGHVIARHGAERVSQQTTTQLGLSAIGAISSNSTQGQMLMGLLGIGTQVGILLPFSRTQESEADQIGLKLMAQAGFDPQQSVELWKNMISESGGKGGPQFLSTHPASESRIQALQQNMPGALGLYQQAQAGGHKPHCPHPSS